MKTHKKTIQSLFVVSLIVVTTVVPSTAQTDDQQFHIPGLDGEVTVRFDAYGVPQIYASTPRDLLTGQGFVHAHDRWWQMEWYRHTGMGRLNELVGIDAIDRDTFIRTLGLPGYAVRDIEALHPEDRELLAAYVAGINSWITGKAPAELAAEYALLGLDSTNYDVEPWQMADSMVLQSLQALSFNDTSILAEVVSELIARSAGEMLVDVVLPPYPYDSHPVTMKPGRFAAQPTNIPANQVELSFDFLADFRMTGSNAWVVAGHLTESGLPLLANDSHMSMQMPSFWYQAGLHCVEFSAQCPYDVTGLSIPGSPGIIIGHNRRVGWGFTNAQIDVADFYRLEINPDNPLQYRYHDGYTDMTVRTETLHPAHADPVEITIRETVFGPVFEQFEGIPLGGALALRWAAADGNHALEAIFAANRATNWEEFQHAFALFSLPGMNVLYADVDGNIGYLLSGVIPKRAAGHKGKVPVPGIDDRYRWQGYVPAMENPRLFNPDAGYIISANNAMIDEDAFPHTIAYFYDYGYRAARIEHRLQAQPIHSVATFQQIQFDGYNPAAPFTLALLARYDFEDDTLNRAVDWLTTWDYQNDVDSAQAALFNAFWAKLLLLGLDELPLYEQSHSMYLMEQMLKTPVHPLWINSETRLLTRDDVLYKAMALAWEEMTTAFGPDYRSWHWGAMHRVRFEPAVFRYIDIENAGIVPVVPVSGGLSSPNATTFDPMQGSYEVKSLPSMRMILDFSAFDQSLIVNSTGQSGYADSAHYADMMPLWASGAYLPFVFSEDAVEIQTQSEWRLLSD